MIRENASNGSINILDPRQADPHKDALPPSEKDTSKSASTLSPIGRVSTLSSPQKESGAVSRDALVYRSSTFSAVSREESNRGPSSNYTVPRSNTETVKKKGPPPPPKPSTGKPRKGVALFAYESTVQGDLSFAKGDNVWVTKELGEWTEGSVGSKKGIFPTLYVRIE
jgi:hypothetical protein